MYSNTWCPSLCLSVKWRRPDAYARSFLKSDFSPHLALLILKKKWNRVLLADYLAKKIAWRGWNCLTLYQYIKRIVELKRLQVFESHEYWLLSWAILWIFSGLYFPDIRFGDCEKFLSQNWKKIWLSHKFFNLMYFFPE